MKSYLRLLVCAMIGILLVALSSVSLQALHLMRTSPAEVLKKE